MSEKERNGVSTPASMAKPKYRPSREPLFSVPEIANRLDELANEISRSFGNSVIHVAPILMGAMVFTSDLIRRMSVKCTLHPILVNSYNGMQQGNPEIIIPHIESLPKKLLLVEDIIDSGTTLDLVSQVLLTVDVKQVEICTLLHKNKVSRSQLDVKYVGFACPDDFVVGYGMDYHGLYRDWPSINRLVRVNSDE